MSSVTVNAGRDAVEVARAEKELFPAGGAPAVTKADLAAYYRDIAGYALPHLNRWTVRDVLEQAATEPGADLQARGRSLGPARRKLRALAD